MGKAERCRQFQAVIKAAQKGRKNEAAVELGRTGGQARARSMSEREREEIARKGGRARWHGRSLGSPEKALEHAEERRGPVAFNEQRLEYMRRIERAVSTLFEFLRVGARRALVCHQDYAVTMDPKSRDFNVFSQRFPASVVGVYDSSATREEVMQDVRAVLKEVPA